MSWFIWDKSILSLSNVANSSGAFYQVQWIQMEGKEEAMPQAALVWMAAMCAMAEPTDSESCLAMGRHKGTVVE